MWNLCLHDSAEDNCDQSLLVSQRPNVRHALSRKSRTVTFWIACECVLLVIGFAKIVKWSPLAIFGGWNSWKMAGLLVRNHSRVTVSLALNFTICLRLFDNLFRNDRASAPDGGVCIYLRQTIPCTRLSQCEQPDVESLWLFLSLIAYLHVDRSRQ